MTVDHIKSHEFEIHGGNRPKDGKSRWPDCLYLTIPRHYAWNMIQALLAELKEENDKDCDLALCGELKIDVPDE